MGRDAEEISEGELIFTVVMATVRMIFRMAQRAESDESIKARFLLVLGNVMNMMMSFTLGLLTILANKAIPFPNLFFNKTGEGIRIRIGLDPAFPVVISGPGMLALCGRGYPSPRFKGMTLPVKSISGSCVGKTQFQPMLNRKDPGTKSLINLGAIQRLPGQANNFLSIFRVRPMSAAHARPAHPGRTSPGDHVPAFATRFIHVLHVLNNNYIDIANGSQHNVNQYLGGAF
jgi:hypothetical protein